MNKTLAIPFIVIFLIAVGVAAFFFMGKEKMSLTDNTVPQTETTIASSQESGKKSYLELLQLTTNQQCTFHDDMGNTGEVFIGNGNVRGDFTSQNDGETINSHVIARGQDMYFWIDGEKNGFSADFSSIQTVTNSEESSSKGVDVNEQVDYNCKSWDPQSDKFVLPDNVEFNDFSNLLKEYEGTSSGQLNPEDAQTEQCAICDTLPPETQVQCKTALNCN